MAALPPVGGAPSSNLPVKPINESRAAAQKAFFDAALGRASPVQQTAQAAPAAAPAQRPVAVRPAPATQAGDEQPKRILRPGSLVNIVV